MINRLILLTCIIACAAARAQTVADVSDLSQIKINTPDRGLQNAGTFHDVLHNYPALRQDLASALVKQFDTEDEVHAAAHLAQLRQMGIISIPGVTDKQTKRIDEFRAKKEAALIAAIKKAQDSVRGLKQPVDPPEPAPFIENPFNNPAKAQAARTASQKEQTEWRARVSANKTERERQARIFAESTALRLRAKAKLDELLGAGIPISKATQDIVNAANPAATASPTPTPTPPDDGL
jgi:hypothetical protein